MLNSLSRITTSGREYIPQIDGLRFLAIIAVIAYHIWGICAFHLGHTGETFEPVGKCFSQGNNGVQLFFAISGFVLALPFARHYLASGKPVMLREYFLRRLTRIEPPYLIQMVLVFFFTALVLSRTSTHQSHYGSEGWFNYTAPHMLASLFYAHVLIFKSLPYPNVVLWSLEVEVQFYLIAPWLVRLFAIPVKWLRWLLILVLIIAWPEIIKISGLDPFAYRIGLLNALPYFLVGFLLVEFYLSGWLTGGKKNYVWDILFLLCGPAVVFYPSYGQWIFLVLCLAAFRGRLASWFMSLPWIITIGGMCYTIYMYHWLMISSLVRGTAHLQTGHMSLDLLVQFIVLTPIILLVSAFLFVWFERPFMCRDWPARFKQFIVQSRMPLPGTNKE